MRTNDLLTVAGLGIAGYLAYTYFSKPRPVLPSGIAPNTLTVYSDVSINPWTVKEGWTYDAAGRLVIDVLTGRALPAYGNFADMNW